MWNRDADSFPESTILTCVSQMTFDEFERASTGQLRAQARKCFERHQNGIEESAESNLAALVEAQFYLNEVERKSSSRVALRDLFLEIVVIVLIGGEIGLAVYQGTHQDEANRKQTAVLNNLERSTESTANLLSGLLDTTKQMNVNVKSTADELGSLNTTTSSMNNGVHDQLVLLYEPSVILWYDSAHTRLALTNTGRTNVEITSVIINGQPWPVNGQVWWLRILSTTSN